MTDEKTDEQDTAPQNGADDGRPKPYPHEGDSRPADADDADDTDDTDDTETDRSGDDKSDSKSDGDGDGDGDGKDFAYGDDETQDFVDRDKIDFDPADGLYTGSAVDGDSDIPGPSESDIRDAQEELGDDEDGDAGAKKAAEKFIEENDVDLEEAKKGEAIAGSAKASGDKGDDS